ncbi:MAG TPA: ATP-binding protein, partial [Bradyrhizobium sp.]|nr:ATP-binding protein [Bradyrhizobium sp.]
ATFVRERDAVLAITDQGPGIPADQRETAFKRFRRGNLDSAGSGIGLSLVARILEVHRASIKLDDGPDGRGLRVEVRFPISTT